MQIIKYTLKRSPCTILYDGKDCGWKTLSQISRLVVCIDMGVLDKVPNENPNKSDSHPDV